MVSLFFFLAVGSAVAGNVLAFGGVNALLEARNKAKGFKDDAASRGICIRIDELSGNTEERIKQKEERVEARINEGFANAEKNRKERSGKLTEFRMKADEWRKENYEKMEAKAETDEQKEAVKKFKETVEAAVESRRVAIDVAINAFRGGVDKAIADHKSAVQETKNAYRESVKTAYEKARNDCESGVDEKTVRANLHSSLQAARGKLKEDRAGVTKFRDAMKDLIAARKTAFEKSITDFKAAMKAAVEELKRSFPESNE